MKKEIIDGVNQEDVICLAKPYVNKSRTPFIIFMTILIGGSIILDAMMLWYALYVDKNNFSWEPIKYELVLIAVSVITYNVRRLMDKGIENSGKLILTKDRLIGKKGLISTMDFDIPLNKIDSVLCHKLLGPLQKHGDLEIITGNSRYICRKIANVNDFKEKIIHQVILNNNV